MQQVHKKVHVLDCLCDSLSLIATGQQAFKFEEDDGSTQEQQPQESFEGREFVSHFPPGHHWCCCLSHCAAAVLMAALPALQYCSVVAAAPYT